MDAAADVKIACRNVEMHHVKNLLMVAKGFLRSNAGDAACRICQRQPARARAWKLWWRSS